MKQLTKKQYEALEMVHLIAAGIFLLAGLGMAFNALESLVVQESILEQSMVIAGQVILTGIVLLVIVGIWYLKDLRGTPFAIQFWGRAYPFQDNSYMENSITHAMHYSWLFTLWGVMLSLISLKSFSLSKEFYLLMIGAVMLVSWSLTYFHRYFKEASKGGDEN